MWRQGLYWKHAKMREREIRTIQNCPQAVWKMAPTSSPSAYTQPEGALKLSGLSLADCPALDISGSLMPCSQGVGCGVCVIWCGWKCWFIRRAAAQSMCLHVRVLGSRKGEPSGAVCAWMSGRGFLMGYSSSCWRVTALIFFSSLDYGLITAIGLQAQVSVWVLDS